MEPLFNKSKFYCPLCENSHLRSEYLTNAFGDTRDGWLANMVTHYRHHHVSSWNKCWGFNGHRYRAGWFKDYDEEKQKVNERAKRQIIRKAKQFLLDNGFDSSVFAALKNTDHITRDFAAKHLDVVKKETVSTQA
jgi:hypothetical protein